MGRTTFAHWLGAAGGAFGGDARVHGARTADSPLFLALLGFRA
jgi:hypothetical protein